MHEILLFIQVFNESTIHDVWISDTYVIGDFVNEAALLWCKENYAYHHFFVSKDTNEVLDNTKTWQESNIVSGDCLILI